MTLQRRRLARIPAGQNPVLLLGEPGVISEAGGDFGRLTIGDGTTPRGQPLAFKSEVEDAVGNATYSAPGDSVPRPYVEIIADFPPNPASYGPMSTPAETRATLNKALAANKAIQLQARQYDIDAPLAAQSGCVILGVDSEKTIISRTGVWNGNTVTIGQNLVGQGAYQFLLKGVAFKQDHAGFNPGTSTSIPNRLSSAQRHVEVWGGRRGQIESCSFEGTVVPVHVKGAAYLSILDSDFIGSWDFANSGLQETFASIQLSHDGVHGLCTVPRIEGCRFYGYPSPTRTVTIGAASFSSHQDAGPLYHVYVEGAEGLILRPQYIGAANSCLVIFNPNGICDNAEISGGFWDSATDAQIKFDSASSSNFTRTVSLRGLMLNSQQLGLYALWVNNSSSAPTVSGLTMEGCIGQGYNKSPLRLSAARACRFIGNHFASYNTRHGGDGDPTYSAGAYLDGQSSDCDFIGNKWGGGLNSFTGDTTAKWGPFFSATSGMTAALERANLGIAGGSVVGGISQSYPT